MYQIVMVLAFFASLPTAANICDRTPAIAQAILEDLFVQTGREFTCHQVDGEALAKVKKLESKSFGQSPKLKTLKPQDLEGLVSLERLDLSSNGLKEFPHGIEKLTRLKELFITDNQLEGPIPDDWEKLVDLELVFMGRNRLSGPLPIGWGNLKKLHHIFLSDNQLSGPIPSGWGDIPRLEFLLLDNNQLEGPIPTHLKGLKELTILSLSKNQLSGPVPEFLGELESLRELGLAHNNFEGPLPKSLGRLEDLKYAVFSHNPLTGPVPKSWYNSRATIEFSYEQLSFLEKLELKCRAKANVRWR